MSDSHRVALITGASRGLGAVIARVLAERGWDLVLGARHIAPLEQLAGSLRTTGAAVLAVDGDIADEATRARLADAAIRLGGLDVLVNNASELGGIAPLCAIDASGGREPSTGPTHPTDPTHPSYLTYSRLASRFLRVLDVNVAAPVALVQLVRPLLATRRGLVVNVSSDAAHGAYPGWGMYGASKAALELVTRTLASELADEGVAAVTVDPGDMRTRMHQDAFPGQDISDRPLPDVTIPFWAWLFDQNPADVGGRRFAAQQENRQWLQPA